MTPDTLDICRIADDIVLELIDRKKVGDTRSPTALKAHDSPACWHQYTIADIDEGEAFLYRMGMILPLLRGGIE